MSLNLLLTKITRGWVKAKSEKFTEHPIANLLRKDLIDNIKYELGDESTKYLIKSSPGAGNWADVPWLSILNPSITGSTQSGVYPVYLFRADGTGVYLSLGFGTTELKRSYGAAEAKKKALELRNQIRSFDQNLNEWDEKIDLRSSTPLGRSYEWASAGAKFYPIENIPADSVLRSDLRRILQIYSEVNIKSEQPKKTLLNKSFFLYKPFLLLAGISGTGKTRFIREQAIASHKFYKQSKSSKDDNENYCLVSVRPDWHEPSDLLGYVSRLSGKPQYVATDTLRFIVQAWKNIITSVVKKNSVASDWRGHPLSKIKPFWLCLDEMNLAPVEQYFSDYLSVLETRCWYGQEQLDEYNSENSADLNYYYHSEPLLKASVIKLLDDNGTKESSNALAKSLGLDISDSDSLDYDIWQYFYHNGIGIPFNLIVAGTVNMDETTHGFSRKVIDRALSFDFGEFFPNDFDHFSAPVTEPKTLSYPVWSDARQHLSELPSVDNDGTKSIEFLKSVNAILKNTPFELAFRALNELLLAVISTQPKNAIELQAVWDDFLMCKVLPRIEGDTDKLGHEPSLLEKLTKLLEISFADFWNKQDGEDDARPDLYQEKITGDDKVVRIKCRSKAKLEWMQKRLNDSSFTSFWP